jgi:hypothetical protein
MGVQLDFLSILEFSHLDYLIHEAGFKCSVICNSQEETPGMLAQPLGSPWLETVARGLDRGARVDTISAAC